MVCAGIASIILSFKVPVKSFFGLLAEIALYCFCIYNEFSQQQQKPKVINIILMNYSIHIVVMCVVYMIFGGAPIPWLLVLTFSSLYQFITFLNYNIQPSSPLLPIIRKIATKLTPQTSQQILVLFELMNIMPLIKTPSPIYRPILFVIYLLWYILYRYATDRIHQMIWAQYKNQILGFASKLPAFLSKLINAFLSQISQLGKLAFKIYRIRN